MNFTVSASTAGTKTDFFDSWVYSYSTKTTGTVVFTKAGDWNWEGVLTATSTITSKGTWTYGGGILVETTEGTFSGSPSVGEGPTVLDMNKTAGFTLDLEPRAVRMTSKTVTKDASGTKEITSVINKEWTPIWAKPIPYPASSTTLSGRAVQMEVIEPKSFPDNGVDIEYVLDYTLVPEDADDGELELELFSPQYQDWRPTAQSDGGDGAPIEFTATLKTKSGQAPQQKISKLEWELVETSREPGIAINWPSESAGNLHDLYFNVQPSLTPPVTRRPVGDTGQKVTVEFLTGEGLTDKISVYPRDWGAWSILRATATLTNGKQVIGRYRGASGADVRLPDRDEGEFIARSWLREKAPGGKSRDDLDDLPEGDGNAGDGLTLYEEYRGFFVQGERKEGDPRKKDYFAVNLAEAEGRGGLALFHRITGLAVHRLNRNELSPDRVINHNVSAGPRRGPQHGVIIQVKPEFKGYAKAESRIDRPSTPRDIEFVGLPTALPSRPTASPAVSYASATVAHELLHTVNVFHHGESDRVVSWSRSGDQLFEQQTEEQNDKSVPVGPLVEIRAFLESGEDVTSKVRLGLRQLGMENGQHSGWENCLLRYDIATTYIATTNPNHRYVGVQEIPGARLCESTEGITVNAPGRNPQSRYGIAAANRGACKRQILVNDLVSLPSR